MSRTVDTTKITGGAEYARVPARLKLFREDRPNGKIETDRILLDEGIYEFTAWVWKDKTEYLEILKAIGDKSEARGSADAVGHSRGVVKNTKEYEKLETVAVGRALAMLGYLVSGEVASWEEMELYEAEKAEKQMAYIVEQIELFEKAKTLDELKALWAQTNKVFPAIIEAKDKRKAELTKSSKVKKEVKS